MYYGGMSGGEIERKGDIGSEAGSVLRPWAQCGAQIHQPWDNVLRCPTD